MANQPLGFAEILVGGILLVTGATGSTLKQTLTGNANKGIAWPWDTSSSSSPDGSGTAGGASSSLPPSPYVYQPSGKTIGNVSLDPGVNMTVGQEPEILKRLHVLAGIIGKPVFVISGYRSPAHSVAVGGFSNDPHTRGEAADIGAGSPTLPSMNSVTDAQLRQAGLYRPFPGESEINHVQLLP